MFKTSPCWKSTDLPFGISLYQEGVNRFTVQYGEQVTCGLDYAKAAAELGECIMHALACDLKLDNGE